MLSLPEAILCQTLRGKLVLRNDHHFANLLPPELQRTKCFLKPPLLKYCQPPFFVLMVFLCGEERWGEDDRCAKLSKEHWNTEEEMYYRFMVRINGSQPRERIWHQTIHKVKQH